MGTAFRLIMVLFICDHALTLDHAHNLYTGKIQKLPFSVRLDGFRLLKPYCSNIKVRNAFRLVLVLFLFDHALTLAHAHNSYTGKLPFRLDWMDSGFLKFLVTQL